MLKVKKFLYCIELETGVTIIGYSQIILSLIMAIAFLLISAFNFGETLNFIKESVRRPNENLPTLQIILVFILVICGLLINVYISTKLIRAVQEQKYKIFRPFLTVGLFFTLLLALEALTSLKALFFVLTGIYAYNWIVVYSLYDEYKTESKINIRISTIEPIEPISNA